MKAELRTITPAYAEELLKKNTHNRKINQSHVEFLTREMREGRWKLNGDTISINSDRLLNGQHRLNAVIKSGITIQCIVVEGLPSDVFDTIDCGSKRSAADVLSIRGEVNTHRVSSALAIIGEHELGGVTRSRRFSSTEIEALLDKHPLIRESVRVCAAYVKHRIGLPSIVDACHYLFSQKDPALAAQFFTRLMEGINLQHGDPCLALRQKLIQNSAAKMKMRARPMMALFIKSWNALREGRKVEHLKWASEGLRPEEYPVIV